MTYYYGTISVLTVVNFVGNSIVLMTFYRHRDMRTPSNSFLCSLALSDMLAGLIYPVYNVSHVEKPAIKHTLGQWWVCLAIITEGTTLETCSSYGIVAIAFSRLLIISHPLRYRVYLTYRNCLVAVGLLWGTCHVVSFAAYMYHQRPRDYCNICRYEVMLPPDFNIYWDIFQFLVPLILMITANVWMAFKARSLSRRVAACFGSAAAAGGVKEEWGFMFCPVQKSFAVVTMLVGCFTISWSPLVIYGYLTMATDIAWEGQEYFRIFVHSSHAINVFIYAGRMADFREHVRRDLRHFLCCCSGPKSVSTNRRHCHRC
nr:hypothetical protein BaRGS_020537 [Batillaria attramentaria]